jgi:hypothetical protein
VVPSAGLVAVNARARCATLEDLDELLGETRFVELSGAVIANSGTRPSQVP